MPRQGRGAQDQAQDWATFLSLGRWSQRTARKHEMKGSFCASSCLPEAVLQTQWLKPRQASKVPGHAQPGRVLLPCDTVLSVPHR